MILALRKDIILLSMILVAVRPDLTAQEKDLQSWYEFGLGYGFKNALDLKLELEQRLKENFFHFDRTLITIAGNYDVTPWLGVAGGARTLFIMDSEMKLRTRYRLHLDAMGILDISDTRLSLRARLQNGFDEFALAMDSRKNSLTNRNMLKLDHAFSRAPVNLFGYIESWYAITGRSGREFSRIRLSTGMGYELDYRSKLSLRYLFDGELNRDDPLHAHVIILGYAYSL